jgi:hypothetical protein
MLHYLNTVKDEVGGYYYDRIRINTDLDKITLRKLLPKKFFAGETRGHSIKDASPAARRIGFRSKIELVAPTIKCLEALSKLMNNSTVKISYLEIARDIFTETQREAEARSYGSLMTLRKKYTSEHFIYDQTLKNDRKNLGNDPTLFGIMTGYFGNRNFKFVLYPRLSKISNDPCIHSEWRITGASLIARKTGIRSIQYLLKFDFRKFFEEKDMGYIAHEKIDRHKFGKWLLGWGKRKSFSRRQQMRISLMSATFLNVYEIRTYAVLVHFTRMKKKKISEKKGRKAKWQRKWDALKDYGKFRERV